MSTFSQVSDFSNPTLYPPPPGVYTVSGYDGNTLITSYRIEARPDGYVDIGGSGKVHGWNEVSALFVQTKAKFPSAKMVFERELKLGEDKLVVKQGEVLKKGKKDPRVRLIQQMLSMPNPIDSFGPQTEAKVIAFQKQFGLPVDGKVGPVTAAKMQSVVDSLNAQAVAAAAQTKQATGIAVPVQPSTVQLPGEPKQEFDPGEDGPLTEGITADTKMYIGIGLVVAGVAAVGLALWLSSKGTKPALKAVTA